MVPLGPGDWVRDHYAKGSDALSANGMASDFAQAVRMVVGATEVIGRDNVVLAAAKSFARYRSIKHDINSVWCPEPDLIVAETIVSYTKLDGECIEIPAVTIFRFEGALVRDIRIYLDSRPL